MSNGQTLQLPLGLKACQRLSQCRALRGGQIDRGVEHAGQLGPVYERCQRDSARPRRDLPEQFVDAPEVSRDESHTFAVVKREMDRPRGHPGDMSGHVFAKPS